MHATILSRADSISQPGLRVMTPVPTRLHAAREVRTSPPVPPHARPAPARFAAAAPAAPAFLFEGRRGVELPPSLLFPWKERRWRGARKALRKRRVEKGELIMEGREWAQGWRRGRGKPEPCQYQPCVAGKLSISHHLSIHITHWELLLAYFSLFVSCLYHC